MLLRFDRLAGAREFAYAPFLRSRTSRWVLRICHLLEAFESPDRKRCFASTALGRARTPGAPRSGKLMVALQRSFQTPHQLPPRGRVERRRFGAAVNAHILQPRQELRRRT